MYDALAYPKRRPNERWRPHLSMRVRENLFLLTRVLANLYKVTRCEIEIKFRNLYPNI